MSVGFVFLITEIGHAESVVEALKKIDGVTEAYMSYGVYDVVTKIEANTIDKLGEIVTRNILRLDKVLSARTMMVYTRACMRLEYDE